LFNVLGREVETLVNEVKQPGTYTAQFDGSGLSSGVYFYRLMVGEFTAMKKLIILKWRSTHSLHKRGMIVP
jgi:hypothetical protein